jgi:hypothetical protein
MNSLMGKKFIYKPNPNQRQYGYINSGDKDSSLDGCIAIIDNESMDFVSGKFINGPLKGNHYVFCKNCISLIHSNFISYNARNSPGD